MWYGHVWYGLCGMVMCGMALCGMAMCGLALCGMVMCGMASKDTFYDKLLDPNVAVRNTTLERYCSVPSIIEGLCI